MVPIIIKRSLRAQVALSIVLPLAVILSLISLVEHARHKEAVMDNLSSLASYSGQMVESSLRHAMLASDFGEVQGILNTVGDNPDIQTVYLLDTNGNVIFSPEGRDVGVRLDNHQATCLPCHSHPATERPGSVVVRGANGQRVFRSMQPIENSPECARCHDPSQRLLGLLLTDLSMAPVEEPLAADLRENVLWGAGAILITLLMTHLVLDRLVLRRLDRFAPAIEGLRSGRVPPPIHDSLPDEIGHLADAFNSMARDVEQRDAENRALSDDLRRQNSLRSRLLKHVITAQEDERRRVARELHDELGQYLSALALHGEAIERLLEVDDRARAAERVATIRALATEATERMYALILDLRPSVLDDLGLAAAIRSYADRLFRDTGTAFEVDAREVGQRLPAEIETALYRICQEALCNVVRHAHAQHVSVTLLRRDGEFEATIEDDGRGFDPASVAVDGTSRRGLGLMGMRERAAQCGGTLHVTASPGSGSAIRVVLPLGKGLI